MAYQHVYQSDYVADADFNIDQFIDLSLNDTLESANITELKINDILLDKQLVIAVKRIITHLLDNNKPMVKPAECICCIQETVNLIHICKCGLEVLCQECFMKRYMRTIIDAYQDNILAHKTKGRINYITLLNIIETRVSCIICKNNTNIQNFCSVYYQPTMPRQITYVMTKQTGISSVPSSSLNYYILQNKNIIELASGIIQASGSLTAKQLCRKDSLSVLLKYGYCLELKAGSPVLNIRLCRDYLLTVYSQLDKELLALKSRVPPVIIPESEIQNYKKVCKIRLSTKTLSPAIFYAIYYKCIELGILFIDINSGPASHNFGKLYKFIYTWNNFCLQVNNLINLYIPEDTVDHGLISILLAEINSIKHVF
jgi:hypothetical protein